MAAAARYVVLKEQDIDVSDAEVEEYTEYLGVDLEFERDLLPIAKKGLLAKLPDGWQACAPAADPDDVFYWHAASQTSVWEHPNDEIYMDKVSEARMQRRCIMVSIMMIEGNDGTHIIGNSLSGKEMVNMVCAKGDDFASIEDRMRQDISVDEGAVLCFVKRNASLIGHSARARTLQEVLG